MAVALTPWFCLTNWLSAPGFWFDPDCWLPLVSDGSLVLLGFAQRRWFSPFRWLHSARLVRSNGLVAALTRWFCLTTWLQSPAPRFDAGPPHASRERTTAAHAGVRFRPIPRTPASCKRWARCIATREKGDAEPPEHCRCGRRPASKNSRSRKRNMGSALSVEARRASDAQQCQMVLFRQWSKQQGSTNWREST